VNPGGYALQSVSRYRRIWASIALALVVVGTGVNPQTSRAQTGGYAESFELTGLVQTPRTYTLADLQAYPSITMTAAFGAGTGFQVGTFTGVSLWDLLQENRVLTDSTRNNDQNRKYVVATGSDNYETVFALAEIHPEFGAELVLIAYLRDGQPLGPSEGMARVVITTDKRGGRLVSNLVRLEVRDIDSPPRTAQ
jgi:DMSO/TMAO reductase YedYZ molybdopterin-dependent catalytic subunit